MIVRPMKDGVRLISQHDHARAAGSLVRHWAGIETLSPLPDDLKEAVFFAVDNHDVGWCKPDETLRYDPETKLPFSFFSTDSDEAIAVWSKSIATCAGFHAFSGYLVSAHFGQLADAGGRGAPPDVLRRLQAFVTAEAKRRESLRENFSSTEESEKEKASLLLRACDTLSLLTCRAPEISPPEGEVHPLTRCGLKVRPTPDDGLEISPWPFDVKSLELRFPGVTIPGTRFENGEVFQEAIDRAEPGVFISWLSPLS
jgi:hypothetical protein